MSEPVRITTWAVYVKGFDELNPEKASLKLRELFAQCGQIVSIDVPRIYRDLNSGFAFVHFETKESYDKALVLNGSELEGVKLKVSKARKPKPIRHYDKYDDADTIYPWTRQNLW